MKTSFSYSLPVLGLFVVLALPLTGCGETPKEPGTAFKDYDTCREMVAIPAGSFQMGDLSGEGDKDEKPVHEVAIGYSFAVGKSIMPEGASNPSKFKGDLNPVAMLS